MAIRRNLSRSCCVHPPVVFIHLGSTARRMEHSPPLLTASFLFVLQAREEFVERSKLRQQLALLETDLSAAAEDARAIASEESIDSCSNQLGGRRWFGDTHWPGRYANRRVHIVSSQCPASLKLNGPSVCCACRLACCPPCANLVQTFVQVWKSLSSLSLLQACFGTSCAHFSPKSLHHRHAYRQMVRKQLQ